MKNEFWKSKLGYWTVIAIVYAVSLGVYAILMTIAGTSNGGTVLLVMLAAALIAGWGFATRAVNRILQAITGNMVLFGSLPMIFQIFLVKLIARCLIAVLAGPLVFPFSLGKKIAGAVCAA